MPGAIERGEVAFRPGPEESSVPERFRLESANFTYELEPVISTPNYTVSRLRFPSPITTPDPENNVVHAEYFAPVGRGPKCPAVVVLHILGADFPLSQIHGGPPGRSGGRGALLEVALLRRASTGRHGPERQGGFCPRTSNGRSTPCGKGFVMSAARHAG